MITRFWLLALVLCLAVLPAGAQMSPRCDQHPNFACGNGTEPPGDAAQTITTQWTIGTGVDFITSNLGVNYTDSDTNPTCGAGEYKIFADTSELKLKKCQDSTITDLDAGGAVAWNSITAPTGALALSFDNTETTTFTWTGNTSTADFFELQDATGNTGTGHLLDVHTVGTSTAKPVIFTAQGTANGVEMSNTGLLSSIGTGGIQATDVACATCIGSTEIADNAVLGTKIAISGQSNGSMMSYDGTDWVNVPPGTTSQVLIGGTPPAFGSISSSHIGAGDLANALTWNELCTADPCALTAAPRNKDTALLFLRGVKLRWVAACGGVNEYRLGNQGCTGAGAPIACCSGVDTGTCENDIDLCWTSGIGSGADSLQVSYEL